MPKWENWRGSIAVVKEIQGGGTTWALNFSAEAIISGKTIFYQTMTLDSVLEDMYEKAEEVGIHLDNIIDARKLSTRSNNLEQYRGKIIVSNKHPTYFGELLLLKTLLEDRYGKQQQEFIWDEHDMDQPGFNFLNGKDGEVPQKDTFNNIFFKRFYRRWFITGSNLATTASDIFWNHILYLHEGQEEEMEQNLLRLEDLKHRKGLTRDFIKDYVAKDEGLYISNFIKNEEQAGIAEHIKTTLAKMGENIDVQIRNEENASTNLKTSTGFLIGHKSLPRAVSLPNHHHQAIHLSLTSHQASIIQRMRILGWGKKLSTGNYVICSDEDWDHLQWAIKMERKFGDPKLIALPPEERHKILQSEELNSKYKLLPNFKDNGFDEVRQISEAWKKIDTMFGIPKSFAVVNYTIVSMWTKGKASGGTRRWAMNPFAMTQAIEKHPLDIRTDNMWARKKIIPPTQINGEWEYTEKGKEEGYIEVLTNSNRERQAIDTDYIIQANSKFGYYDIFFNPRNKPKHIKKLKRKNKS